jgi:DNA-binding IclR family transcriptional regulator
MIKSVARVYEILQLLQRYPDGLSHTRVADRLQIPHSSLSVLLNDLVELQYVTRDDSARLYKLGPQMLILAGSYLSSLEVVRIGRPFISQLMQMTQCSVVLMVPNGYELLFVVRENGPQHIVSSLQVGDVAPMHVLPAGRVILSHFSDQMLDDYFAAAKLSAFTSQTITDPTKLREEIARVRAQGIATCRNELREGLMAIGLAINDQHNRPVAGIDVVVPNLRLNSKKKDLIMQSLRQVAAEFSYQMGCRADLFAPATG